MKRAHPQGENIPLHVLGASPGDGAPFEMYSLEVLPPEAHAGYPHRHSFYQILFLTGGRGSHVVDFAPTPVAPPCLYFVSPGQVHFWDVEEPLAGKVLRFGQEFLVVSSLGKSLLDDLAFFHATEGTPRLELEGDQAALFSELIGRLEEEYRDSAFGRVSVLRAYLHILLVQIQRRWQTTQRGGSQSNASTLVRRFKKMVSERFLVDRAVASYARSLGLSPGHLSDTVKAVTQRTAGELIREEVTTEAKRLLAHSELAIAEIAYALHFEDASYFGRFFRREAGVSPGAFRQAFREKYQRYR